MSGEFGAYADLASEEDDAGGPTATVPTGDSYGAYSDLVSQQDTAGPTTATPQAASPGLMERGKRVLGSMVDPSQWVQAASARDAARPAFLGGRGFEPGPGAGRGAINPPLVDPTAPAPKVSKPYATRSEALDDAVNLLEEGADKAQVFDGFRRLGISQADIVAHGQQRGSKYFAAQPPLAAQPPSDNAVARGGEGTMRGIEPSIAEGAGNLIKRVKGRAGQITTGAMFNVGALGPGDAGHLMARDERSIQAAMPGQDVQEGLQEIGRAKNFGEAASALASNPKATFTLLAESLLLSAPALAATGARLPAALLGGAVGANSGAIEFGGAMADVLGDQGVDMLNASDVARALSDPATVDKIKANAAKRGLTIGAIDALTAGFAGRFLKPALRQIETGKLAGKAAQRATIGAWAKELGLQVAGGAGGEAAGQALTGDFKPADILLEGLGEAVTAPLEAHSNLAEARHADPVRQVAAEIDASVGRAPGLPYQQPQATAWEIAKSKGFHVDPPLTTDKPSVSRSKTAEMFRDLGAKFGLSSKAIDATIRAADGRPLEDMGPFFRRAAAAFQARGMFGSEIDPDVLGVFDGPMEPPPEPQAAGKPTAAAPKPTDEPQAQPGLAEAASEGAERPAATGAPASATGLAEDVAPGVPQIQQGSLAKAAASITSPVDLGAHQAATSPTNARAEPTQAQKEAGNYKVGRARVAGMDIRIENPQGSKRRGVSPEGKPWETEMQAHYGYFPGTEAADGDALDVFVKPGTPEDWRGPVFVVDQIDPKTGKLDEHKVVLGAANEAEATALYRSNYDAGWQGLGAITRLPLAAFKAWAKSGRLKEPLGDLEARQQEIARGNGTAPDGVSAGGSAGGRADTGSGVADTGSGAGQPAGLGAVARRAVATVPDGAPVRDAGGGDGAALTSVLGKPLKAMPAWQLRQFSEMESARPEIRRAAQAELKRRDDARQERVAGMQTGQLLRLAKTTGKASEDMRRAAAAEVKRRETDAMWRERAGDRDAEEQAILDQARDEQVVEAKAVSRAGDAEAPTAMAQAMQKALARKGKPAKAEPVDAPVPATENAADEQAAPPAQPDLSQTGGEDRGGRQQQAAKDGNVDATAPVYATVVEQETVGQVRLPRSRVSSPEDAAAVFRSQLMDSPRERFEALVLDKDGEPIAMLKLFAGAISQTSVYPDILAREVYSIDGAHTVWIAHNHPSGTSKPSPADEIVTEKLAALFSRDLGVALAGHVVVSKDQWAHIDPRGRVVESGMAYPAGRAESFPTRILERTMRAHDKLVKEVTSPSAARAAARSLLPGKSGVILMDAQHDVTAAVPMEPGDMAALRGSGRYAEVVRMLSRSNASVAMLRVVDPADVDAAQNLAAALRGLDARVLDILVGPDLGMRSEAERGTDIGSGSFFSVAIDPSPKVPPISREELGRVVKGLADRWKAMSVQQFVIVDHVDDFPADIARSAREKGLQLDQTEGVLHRGKVYLLRPNIRSAAQAEAVLFHEVLGHLGTALAMGGRRDVELLTKTWRDLGGLPGVQKMTAGLRFDDGATVWQRLQPYIRGSEAMPAAQRQALIMDEMLAFMAQRNDTAALTRFKAYLSDMKASLAATAREWGLNRLADLLERSATDWDVLALLRDARTSIETGTTPAGQEIRFVRRTPQGGTVPAFSQRADEPLAVPDAIVLHPLSAATKHADYAEAKAGDLEAAGRLARDLVTPALVDQVRAQVGSDRQVIVQPVDAIEATGRNKIPRGTAEVLAAELGATSGTDIIQSTRAHRTSMDGLERVLGSPEFDGPVERGAAYVLVDDTLTQGGTFAALASHIRQNGGEVAAVVALTGKGYSAKLTLDPTLLKQVRELYSQVEPAFRAATGRGFDSLTESEARYLARHRSPDAVRDRITAAGSQVRQRADEADPGQGPVSDQATTDDDTAFSVKAGFALPEFGRTGKAIEAIQNRYNRWKQAVEAVRRQGGTVTDANDFYQAEERYWGIVGAQLDDFKGEVQALVKAVKKDGLELSDVALYAYAQHAPERNAQIAKINPKFEDGGSGMTNEQAQAIIDDAEKSGLRPALERHAATLREWTAGTRQALLDAGLISQAEFNQWTDAYKNYVPLRGYINDDGSRRGTGGGFDIRGKESIRAMGRKSMAGNIVEHILQDRARALIRAGKNDVLRRFGQFVLDNPDPGLWEINALEKRRGIVQTPSGEQVVENEAINKAPENTVALKDAGETIYITVKDQALLKQLKNLHDEASLPFVIGGLQWANRTLSRMYTSLNPVFTVLNGARDVTAGAINMVGVAGYAGAGKLLGNLPAAYREAFMGEVRGKPSQAYEEYRRTGGKTGFMDFKDIEGYAKELAQLAAESEKWRTAVATPGGWAKTKAIWRRSRGSVRRVLDAIESYNGAVENATRFAAFKAARESGKSVAQAASVAKNITVNFNRRGSMGPVLGAWFLFFNPAVQGSARMIEAMKSREVLATIGMGMAGVFGLALANASVGGDDDGDGMAYWDKVPPEVKERNLVIMLPPGVDRGETVPGTEHGRYIKIPLPYGFNAFAALATTAADMLRNASDPVRGVSAGKGALRILKAFVGAWVPVSDVAPSFDNPKATALIGVPDALDPVMEAVLNVNSFGGQLYPEGMGQDKLPDSEKVWGAQKGTWKHQVARWLNETTGGSLYHEGAISVTPASIDNVVRGYGGGVATFLTSIADTLVTQGVNRDSFEWWRAPFARQLYGEVDTQQDQALAYERLSQIEQGADPLKRAEKAGDARAASAIREEFGPLADMGKVAQSARQRLTKIRKEEIRVIEDEEMTDAAKNASLRGWERERQAVYDRVNSAVNTALEDDHAP